MENLLKFFLQRVIRKGELRIITANGKEILIGQAGTEPKSTIRFHDKNLPFKLLTNFNLAFGEAYMDGRLTVEQVDLLNLFTLISINYCDSPPFLPPSITGPLDSIRRLIQQYNPIGKAQKNVAHHYDLSDRLYKLFLDEDMQYSCAYFESPTNSLETAQQNKKRHIANKLILKPGMKVLDIGCGWGGMAIFLAKNYGVEVTGVTLSVEQHKVAIERAKAEGVEDKVQFHLRDYREETTQYDRIVSVGMFEHVGINHYQEFFTKIKSLLKDDGIALLHSIGRMDGPGTTDPWLRKYIFPGGYAPALSEVLPVIEKLGLWSTDIEILRLHYAETLKEWRHRFNLHRAEIAKLYDERFCRMWEMYLTGAEMDFRYLSTMVFQIQLAKNVNTVPLTRDYMYPIK